MNRIVSLVCQIEGGFLINELKNAMDAHGSRLRGNSYFGHPGQMLKWMDLRVSSILYTLFDHYDIFKIKVIALCCLKWFVRFAKLMAVFIYEWKNVMDAHRSRLLGDGSFGHPGQVLLK